MPDQIVQAFCGEGGIRTLGTGLSPYNGLANRPFRPLRHLSVRAAKIKINYFPHNTVFLPGNKKPGFSVRAILFQYP